MGDKADAPVARGKANRAFRGVAATQELAAAVTCGYLDGSKSFVKRNDPDAVDPVSKRGGRLRRVASALPTGPDSREATASIVDFLARRGFSDTTANLPPNDIDSALALSVLRLQQNDPDAVELFTSVIRKSDSWAGWLGLAIANHSQGHNTAAGIALAHALSHNAVTIALPIAKSVAQSARAPGWCVLGGKGILTVQLVRTPRDPSSIVASVDGKPLRLKADGAVFTGRLSSLWHRARELVVRADDVDLLGSPIDLRFISRLEGVADTDDGDLHGWAWHPSDPDRDPVLSVVPYDGGPGITVLARDRINTVVTSALARPRAFRIPADQLRHFDGPVRVCGPDGRDLTGSPLDPSAQRRGAETAARIVAGQFPAPGTAMSTAPSELVFLSVPAHITGGPVVGGYNRRPVEIVVPVYGQIDLTLACLASVLSDLPPWASVTVIDDASPDPRVSQELGKLAGVGRVTLLTNERNRGFPGTANVGMRQDASRDIVLLNSDTLVPPGWLTSLREAAYSAPDIGSATPISNDATILSYPSVEHPNATPTLIETCHLDALAQAANSGCLVDIPTAVGFCMYIKRDCLNATGLFREDLFAQGYGEENDFSIRARHLGWRHVAVPSVFVAHVGGQSFSATKPHLIERNSRTLNQLHPGYDALIHRFQSADPMAEPRRRLDLARWLGLRTEARSVLLVTHGRGGGVQRRITDRSAELRADGFRPIVLWPVASRNGHGSDCVVGDGPEGGTPNLRFSIPGELDMLAQLLKADSPVRAEVHHLIGHDHRLLNLFERLAIPYDVVIHDYSWLCPRINLMGPGGRYCGEPDLSGCEACVSIGGTLNDEATDPKTLRERSGAELAAASSVIVPSGDVAIRVRRHFPTIEPRVVSWEDDGSLPPAAPSFPSSGGIRRVCVIGAIGIEKGYEILLACARDAEDRKLKLQFVLVGHSRDDARLIATGKVEVIGKYQEHDAVALIRQQKAQLAWQPALWPETWSYTLTLAWQAGLNVLAFNIGTPAERLQRTGRGWLCPLGLSPRALNDLMLILELGHSYNQRAKVGHRMQVGAD